MANIEHFEAKQAEQRFTGVNGFKRPAPSATRPAQNALRKTPCAQRPAPRALHFPPRPLRPAPRQKPEVVNQQAG